MRKAVPAMVGDHAPARPLGGWLATYGKLDASGAVRPTTDREGHHFAAAAEAVGQVDFSNYLKRGRWNDTHEKVWVGVPTVLEHHGRESELAQAHRKVGFWTEGHLFDRHDPRSWTDYTSYRPTPTDLDRADYYWTLATMLKGTARAIGFSADGNMILSRCGTRIVWAGVDDMAVCELPQNPDATAIPLKLAARDGGPIPALVASMMRAGPCGDCACPPGARCPVVPIAKAPTRHVPALQPQPGDPLTATDGPPDDLTDTERDALAAMLAERFMISVATARRWIATYLPTPGDSP
jgi:hypothetical protein